MRRTGVRAIGAAVLVLLVAAPPAAIAGAGGAGAADLPEFLLASGLDHGPVEGSVPGMHQTDGPGTSLEWQQRFRRTGTGAYHAVGGDLRGDETIGNQASSLPLGGLEVWAGGAFKFVSFPDAADAVWVLAAVPTDGDAGADNKPVVAITGDGRLRLTGSNTPDVFAESRPLVEGRWYALVLHGRNGVGQTQQLFVYNGRTDRLIERVDLVLDVTGSFVNRLTKWGFGTSQDSTGLEYYLDDVFHARGGTNPGPVRVFPKAAASANGSGFQAVGGTAWDEVVDDAIPDGDATYLASTSGRGEALFGLEPVARKARGHRVFLVQVTAVVGGVSEESVTAAVGVGVGSDRYLGSVTVRQGYRAHLLSWAENPSTNAAWRVREAFSGVVEGDASGGELRLTAIWWDVVAAPR
jgi:hypothetical protein